MAENREQLWRMTAIGLAVAAVTAVVTGLVVANWTSMKSPDVTAAAKLDAPSASPATTATEMPAPKGAPTAQSPAASPRVTQSDTTTPSGVPPKSVVEACNRQAAAQAGPPRDQKGKIIDTAKDAGIGAVGGAAVGALGGAIAGGGKGAGKGAAIGGLVGAGGGTLYGIYDNKKHDEAYRNAYAGCMKSRGYTG